MCQHKIIVSTDHFYSNIFDHVSLYAWICADMVHDHRIPSLIANQWFLSKVSGRHPLHFPC